MEQGNLLAKIKKSYGAVYEDSEKQSIHCFGIQCKTSNVSNATQITNGNFSNNKNISIPINNSQSKNKNELLLLILEKLSKRTAIESTIFTKQLYKIVNYDTEKHPKVFSQRLQFIKDKAPFMIHSINKIVSISIEDLQHAVFLFDNLTEINQILAIKKVSENEHLEIFKALDQNTYPKFLACQSNNLYGHLLVADFVYNNKIHKIEFSNDKVTVDASEVISLISGINSHNAERYNDTIRDLLPTEYSINSTTSAQIAEGILIQVPKLAHIAKKYTELSKKWSTWLDNYDDVVRKQQQFFDSLFTNNVVPRVITLHKIVPDPNALNNAIDTVMLFIDRTNA